MEAARQQPTAGRPPVTYVDHDVGQQLKSIAGAVPRSLDGRGFDTIVGARRQPSPFA